MWWSGKSSVLGCFPRGTTWDVDFCSKIYWRERSEVRRKEARQGVWKWVKKFSKNVISDGDFQVDHRKLWSTSYTTLGKVWPLVACLS